MQSRPGTILCLAVAVTAVSIITAPALAVDRTVFAQANGSGACQAALPSYEGQIRKRPLAIQNEGSAGAFMTCSPVSLQGNALHASGHELVLINNTAVARQVNCTGVTGPQGATTYMPKSVSVPGNGAASLSWLGADGVDSENLHTMNMSCMIPPGIGIRTVYTRQVVDVGA
jgi:hypothetical protein